MSQLIVMRVKEEKKSKTKKLDFAHVIIDGPKSKKNKDNDNGKNKIYVIFGVIKASTSDTKYIPECHHFKKREHIRKDCKKFKDWLAKNSNNL
jgi:hypothetical protein